MAKAFLQGSLLEQTGRPVSPVDVRDFDTLDPILDYIETFSGSILDLPLRYEDVDEDWNLEHQPPEPMPGDNLPPLDDDRVVRVLTRSVFTSIGANSLLLLSIYTL